MKVLWITAPVFPKVALAVGIKPPFGGGWMYGVADQLSKRSDINLAVAAMFSDRDLKVFDIDDIRYYLLPEFDRRKLEMYWKKIIAEFRPDIIHIHGSEYTHGLACVNADPTQKYVLSIQGIVSVYHRYYLGGIEKNSILKNITLRDFVKRNNLFQARKELWVRGEAEKILFLKTKNIIGRTTWDYAHTKALNPSANYFFCNESLRDPFYGSKKWDINKKNDHTIFLSQAGVPLKGLQKVIEAIPFLIRKYPDLKIKVSGINIFKNRGRKISGYGNYINKLIRKYHLENHIDFLGPLNEIEMIEQYLSCHVFICPSSIENSPNSLGEAQLLGVPAIASYVGGSPDMIEHKKTGFLYRFEEVEMLAYYIDLIFSDKKLCVYLSDNEISEASKRHDRERNLSNTIDIYNQVLNEPSALKK